MSDTLKTNQDRSDLEATVITDGDVHALSIPNQDQYDEDVDAINAQPLFQDEEDDSLYMATPNRRRRLWLIVVSSVLLLAIIGGSVLIYMQRTRAAQVQYRTIPVSIGSLTKTVSASGPLLAKAEYDMNFGTTGQIKEIDVHVGEQVKAGWVLAKLNAPGLEIAVEQAQLTVNNAQETYNTAVNNGDAQTTLDADYNSLQSAQLQLQTAQNNLAAATLIAPANTTVAAINGSVGQTASSSSTSSFMVLLNTSGFTINAAVNEVDIANVQVNQPVQFSITAYPSQSFRATVSSISIVGTTVSGVVSYPVTLTVNMDSIGNAHLYPGMTATANITTAQRIGALLVSNSAFTFTTTALQAGVISRSALTQSIGGTGSTGVQSGNSAQSTSSRRVVLVLRNGKLTPVLVTVGLTNGTFSEVLSGLNQGDQVVVGATGGAFANLSTTGGATTGGSPFRSGGFGGGNGGTGGTRTGSGG
ncbi:MAG TPA: efflux RND transporter periplasmic adaptor subunit [Ktedonobacteraceae bacterium]